MQFHLYIFGMLIALSLFLSLGLCGRIKRVVGGDVLTRGAWPWLVSLNFKGEHEYLKLQGLKHLCGGTLIHPQWVLTAAHCVHVGSGNVELGYPDKWEVVVGEYNRRVEDPNEQHMQVDQIHVYPAYHLMPQLTGDIALLKLASEVQLSDDVSPVELDIDRQVPPGTSCAAAGWGQHSPDNYGDPQYGNGTILPHVVEVNKVSESDCQTAYVGHWPLVDHTVSCWASQYRDTCNGDSGGPLICTSENGDPVLTGIVSVGIGCARKGFPGIYTHVSTYGSWIFNTIGQ